MYSCHLRYFFVLLICALVYSVSGSAQERTAAINGTVTDERGAVITGALVKATNKQTLKTKEERTDAEGHYAFTGLPPGDYTIEARAKGFQVLAKEARVTMGATTEINLQLALNAVSESVIVTSDAARVELERVPGATALIPQREIRQTLAYNLKDALAFTPGVLAQPRYGSDETQLSIRGSGLRNNYHARGVNLLINGMPYQDADGFSDYETIELMATERVEVWKGANALRYGGNTLGGAINFVTPTGETAAPFEFRVQGGSFGLFKAYLSSGGKRSRFDYFLSASDTELKGFRRHSQQGRQRFFGNFGWQLSESTDLRFDVVYANIAEKLPGALTREQLYSDPRQADPNNVQQDWGRFVDYTRVGARLRHRFRGRQEISFTVHAQYRNLLHPIFQVLDQDTRNFGGEIRYSFTGERNRFVIGFAPQIELNGERRFENISGRSGARTALFNSGANHYGLYFEEQFDIRPFFTFVAGGRLDHDTRRFDDLLRMFGDRSDRRAYSAISPKVGFVWRPHDEMQVFGNVSRTYEPPILGELTSYGAPGFLDLKAQNTWQYEIGTRGQFSDRLSYDFAFYDAEIDNEVINLNVRPFPGAPFTIPTFRSAPQTRHLGLEVAAAASLFTGIFNGRDRLTWRTAYSLSRFRYVDDPAYGGNYLPGAPPHLVRSELRYEAAHGFWIAPNVDWSPATYFVNSANTDRNDKYAVLNLRAGYERHKLGVFFEAENLTNRIYSASVQVDVAPGFNEPPRYFEPSNGRSAYVGLSYRFGK
jgi:iron complex outermembrane receptor protein